MRKVILINLFFLLAFSSFGQGNYQDVVHLKNGSIIRGIIIEQIPNKSIKIETADKSMFVFGLEDIEKITKENFVNTLIPQVVSLKNWQSVDK